MSLWSYSITADDGTTTVGSVVAKTREDALQLIVAQNAALFVPWITRLADGVAPSDVKQLGWPDSIYQLWKQWYDNPDPEVSNQLLEDLEDNDNSFLDDLVWLANQLSDNGAVTVSVYTAEEMARGIQIT